MTVLYQVPYTHVVPTRIRPIITITIDAEQEEALRRIRDTEGIPVSFQVRKALEMWFKAKGIKAECVVGPRKSSRGAQRKKR